MKITVTKETSTRDNDCFVFSLAMVKLKQKNRSCFYVGLFMILMRKLCDFIAWWHSILEGKQLHKNNRCYLLKMHAVIKSSDQVPSTA